MNYESYVCGTRFRDLSHFVWEPDKISLGIIPFREDIQVIYYTHTHNVNSFFNFINSKTWDWSDNPIVLISHNSDGSVRNSKEGQEIREHDADASLLPPNVIKWYAQNVECSLDSNPKIVPIPIGLENRYCFDYDKAEMLFNKPHRLPSTEKEYYFNCNLYTNFAERSCALNKCQQHSDSVNIRLCQNGHDYNRYLEDILNHKFIISPRGNGLDCHRTYEALYLGRMPVMRNIPSIASFNLPILWVEEWSELFSKFYLKSHTNLNALDMNYWKQRIANAE